MDTSTKILYDTGATPLNRPAALLIVALLIGTGVCLYVYFRQKRAGTLKVEVAWTLLVLAGLAGITAVVALASVVPDVIQPPVVERGRVMEIYDKMADPENGVIVGQVKLSNGADVTIPDVLKVTLKLGSCVEITRTPATDYALIARQLPPDACITTG